MKIHRLSIILATPLLIIIGIMGYFVWLDPKSNLLAYVLVPLIPIALIYMFSPEIDYWWLSRNPVELDPQVIAMLKNTNPVYPKLSHDAKTEFNNRLSLHVQAREYVAKGMEEDNKNVPYDIKMMISQIPVTMTWRREKKDFKNWERIILYKHPFPSPRFKFLHTMETHAEDGVVILSLEHVEKALIQKGHHYDVAWHAYAEAFIKANPAEPYPDLTDDIWRVIEEISPQNKQTILATLGFENIDPMPVLINLYFNYQDMFERALPATTDTFDRIFNSQPNNTL